MHLKVALGATIVAIGLVIGAWATEWYRINFDHTNILGDADGESWKFYCDHLTASPDGGDTQNHKYNQDPKFPKVADTFSTCLTFLTVGGAVLIGAGVITALRLFFDFKSKIWTWIVILGTIAAEVLLCISFFTFLNMPKALADDHWPECSTSLIGGPYNQYMCDKILGKDNDYDGGTLQWLPGVGWWLLLGAIVFGAIASGETLKSAPRSSGGAVPVGRLGPLRIDPADIAVGPAIYHGQSAVRGVPEHDCLRFGQVHLHDRHRNSHRLDFAIGLGDDHARRRPAIPIDLFSFFRIVQGIVGRAQDDVGG